METDYRYLAWFELRGEDFYWGPATATPDIEGVEFAGAEIRLDLPADLDALPRAHWKGSRHRSGMFHKTSTGSGAQVRGDVYVTPPTELRRPTLFAGLIEKPTVTLPPYNRSLTRGGAGALVVRLKEKHWALRTAWEFYLSPAGVHSAPTPVFAGAAIADETPITFSFGPVPDVVLVIRQFVLVGAFESWRPDVGIWFSFDRQL